MNYLAVRALHHYSNQEGPHRTKAKHIYDELRLVLYRATQASPPAIVAELSAWEPTVPECPGQSGPASSHVQISLLFVLDVIIMHLHA